MTTSSVFDTWLEKLRAMKHWDPESQMPEHLVVRPGDAHWLSPEVTGNPTSIGVLADVPANSMEFYLQEIPAGEASDLQRHAHESVHIVTAGSGYSEVGPRVVRWVNGDLIYTPPWVWHRHYNDGTDAVKMLLVENSRLLDHLGLNRRESAGLLPYGEFKQT